MNIGAYRFGPRIALLTLLCLICAWTIATRSVKPPAWDNYESYAYSLAEWGVFAAARDSTISPAPGVGRAPLYPLFLAALMRLHEHDKARGKCFVDRRSKCDLRGGLTPFVQMLLAAASVFLIFEMAVLFGARPSSALLLSVWAAFPVVGMAYEYQVSEALALPLFGLTSFFLAQWFGGRANAWATASAGGCIGLLSLTRVAYDYFIPVVALALLLIPSAKSPARPEHLRQRVIAAVALVAAYGVIVTPWHARNYLQFGEAVASEAGVAGVLAMRTSYNRMSLGEGVVAIVYFLPGFGDSLAKAIFPERMVAKFNFSHPDGFRQRGYRLLAEARRAHPDPAKLKRALLAQMLSSPVRHALVSIPLTVDGIRDVFWMLPLALVAIFLLIRQRRWWVLTASVMTVFNLLFHAALTHFRSRYGMPMLFGIAPLAALGLTYLISYYVYGERCDEFSINDTERQAR